MCGLKVFTLPWSYFNLWMFFFPLSKTMTGWWEVCKEGDEEVMLAACKALGILGLNIS